MDRNQNTVYKVLNHLNMSERGIAKVQNSKIKYGKNILIIYGTLDKLVAVIWVPDYTKQMDIIFGRISGCFK